MLFWIFRLFSPKKGRFPWNKQPHPHKWTENLGKQKTHQFLERGQVPDVANDGPWGHHSHNVLQPRLLAAVPKRVPESRVVLHCYRIDCGPDLQWWKMFAETFKNTVQTGYNNIGYSNSTIEAQQFLGQLWILLIADFDCSPHFTDGFAPFEWNFERQQFV